MKHKNMKRNALITSIISLLLCVSMLVGTTFAWFTDSVTSTNNVIKAGNLDIVVEYSVNGTDWYDLDGAEDVFQSDLWEPGHTEVIALRIRNNGTLALKYIANMNTVTEVVGKNKDGGDIVLSKILKVSTLAEEATIANDIFTNENSTAWQDATIADFFATNVLGTDVVLLPGAAHYTVMKVDMPETVGNEANHNGTNVPYIEFGVNVVATQKTYEEDTFGDQYDKDSLYPEVPVSNVTKDENNEAEVKTPDEDVKIGIPAAADAGEYKLEVGGKTYNTDTSGNTTVSMDISLLLDGEKVTDDGTAYEVSVTLEPGLTLTGLTHNGTPINDYSYNMASGVVTFTTTHFSPFSFTYKDEGFVAVIGTTGYTTLEAALDAASGKEIALVKSISLQNDLNLGTSKLTITNSNITFDLNGYDLDASRNTSRPIELYGASSLVLNAEESTVQMGLYGLVNIVAGFKGTLTINGGTYTGETDNGSFVKPRSNNGTVINLNDVTVNDASTNGSAIYNGYISEVAVANNVKLNVNGGEFNSFKGFVNFYDGTFKNATLNVKHLGIYNSADTEALIENCTINVSGEGDGPYYAGAPTAAVAASTNWTNTIVKNSELNSNKHATAIYTSGGTITLESCTVQGDLSHHHGGYSDRTFRTIVDGVENSNIVCYGTADPTQICKNCTLS